MVSAKTTAGSVESSSAAYRLTGRELRSWSRDRLERLSLLVPPLAHGRGEVSWALVEQRLGYRLPADYKTIVETYGPGSFDDFLHIFQPETPQAIDLAHQQERTIWALEYLQERGEAMPYPVDELDAIGRTDNGDVMYWLQRPAHDPDEWTVVVNEARGPEWAEYHGGLAAFLVAVFSGASASASFRRTFPAPGRRSCRTTDEPRSPTREGTSAHFCIRADVQHRPPPPDRQP